MTPEDMKALWASHCRYEFELRDVEGALSTMVDDPYLLHVPVMTGGRGREGVERFYASHFIPRIPADWEITPISRRSEARVTSRTSAPSSVTRPDVTS